MKNANTIVKTGTMLVALVTIAVCASHSQAQTQTAAASLDQILEEISTYAGGMESAPFWKLRDYVYARKDNPTERVECEARLLEFLGTNATPVAKMAVSRHLRLIGSDRSVPVLQGMLLAGDTADMALYALQKIPGSAADKALLQTLPNVGASVKTSIIAALGERRCAGAVTALSALMKADTEFAGAAALALGEIGGEAACAALLASLATVPAELKPVVAAAALRGAEGLAAGKKPGSASNVYAKLLADETLPSPVREAAMIGKISTAGGNAGSIVLGQLKSADPGMQEAAIGKIRDVFKPDGIGPVCSLFPGLAEGAQVRLLAVLAGYPGARVLPVVLAAARSNSQAVRIAALKTLEAVGDASTVPLLVEAAAGSTGPEQNAARSALALVKDRAADVELLGLLSQKPADNALAEVILAVGERRIYSAKDEVAACLASSSPRVRVQALRALRAIGTPSDMTRVLKFVLNSSADSEIAEGATTVNALAQKMTNPAGRSTVVRDMMTRSKDPKEKARLCSILGRIGDDSSLPLLRTALSAGNSEVADAAARAIAAWPTLAARDDIVQLAQKSGNETHRLLALQGFLRLVRSERYRKPDAAVADLRMAYVYSTRPEERRLILGILPNFACPEALELSGILLGEPAVKPEAQAAIDRIKARLAIVEK
jgi:HEAT repeat protein